MKSNLIETRAKLIALSLFEAGKQVVLKEQQDPGQVPPTGTAPPMPQEQQPQNQQPAPAVDSTGQNLTVESLIEKLNVIRGGKSFDAPEVHSQLNALYQNIQDQDKITLDRILIDIGKAVQESQTAQPPAPQNGQTPPQQTPVQSAGAQQPSRAMQPPPIAAQ